MALLKKIHSFDAIINRLENILDYSYGIEIQRTYKTSGGIYPLIKILLGKGNSHRALISAGIHGDEPGGVETIVKFLQEKRYLDYLDKWEITLLPCINPFGYEFGIRENHQGKDLNRLFKTNFPPLEVVFAQTIINKGFEISIDLHEDNDSNGYYLYQKGIEKRHEKLGLMIINSLIDTIPINLKKEIEGSKAERGVIGKELNLSVMEWWPMALYSYSRGTQICLTLEAPGCLELKTRVDANLMALNTALNQFFENS